MNWWIISFLEFTFLDHIFSTQIGGSFLFCDLETKMIQKCKFQKRNDPPVCVISFLEFTFLDLFFKTQIGDQYVNMVHYVCGGGA